MILRDIVLGLFVFGGVFMLVLTTFMNAGVLPGDYSSSLPPGTNDTMFALTNSTTAVYNAANDTVQNIENANNNQNSFQTLSYFGVLFSGLQFIATLGAAILSAPFLLVSFFISILTGLFGDIAGQFIGVIGGIILIYLATEVIFVIMGRA